MLIVLKNGQPNGIAYSEDKPEFHAHHAQYGEKCVWLPGVKPEYDADGNCTTTLTFEQLKAAKISEIQQSSNSAIASMTVGYTVGEVQSFEQQRRGAADILAGNTGTEDAQYVAALAAARAASGDEGMTAFELAGRIAANAAAAAQATIAILGLQQGLEVRARAATTPEELEAIVWSGGA